MNMEHIDSLPHVEVPTFDYDYIAVGNGMLCIIAVAVLLPILAALWECFYSMFIDRD